MSLSLQAQGTNPPASAYAALTASSKLQHLNISECRLPADVWQHLFPSSRLLPNLQAVDITMTQCVWQQPDRFPPFTECSRLVSCCPGLQSLKTGPLASSAALLAPLRRLSELRVLHCGWDDGATEVVQAVCQLTALRELGVRGKLSMEEEGWLLQLTQLRQLTKLCCWVTGGPAHEINLAGEVHALTCLGVVSLLVGHKLGPVC